ncbi:MSP1, partial [Symbiodinium pilosum]
MKDANYCEWEGIRCDEESKKCVEWIDVAEKNLTGELPMELGKLANLTNLWLGENLLLSGNLHALSPLVKLRQLELPNTQITGELDALQGMKQLEYLVLSQSLVHGKLEALQELKQLRELSLSRTNVSGDLGALQELVDIEDVQLSETQVTGHLKALHGLGHLIRLDLSKTKITGTLQDLLKFPELEQAALRQTEVTGRLTNDWLGGLPRLNVLDLADSQVHLVPTATEYDAITKGVAVHPMLPALSVLDVSGCPLNSPVEKLMWPFAWSKHVVKVIAKGCGLTGTLPYMDDHHLTFSLQTLDLSENSIQRVEGLVSGGLLSLADNAEDAHLTFDKGVLRGAFHRKINIDLRGVTLTEQQAGEVMELLPPQRKEKLVDRGRLACDDLRSTVLEVTPNLFLTDQLCRCAVGRACFFPAEERCNSANSTSSWKAHGCAKGYEGTLCSICAKNFRSRNGRCKRCDEATELSRCWLAGAGVLVAVAAAGIYVAWRNGALPLPSLATDSSSSSSSAVKALIPLLLGQGPVLLQFFQLWGVLTALVPAVKGDAELTQEISYWLQLTAAGVRDALSLECFYGRLAWSISAFASPSLPLLLLILCLLIEVIHWSGFACWSRGRGVDWALKVFVLFFIGGAASCEKLLRCQEVDAGGDSLHEHAFRVALPHLRCKDPSQEATWAIYVGYGSAVAYGVIIPCFLVFLIVKQNMALAANRRCVCWWVKENEGKKVIAHAELIEPVEDEAETDKDPLDTAPQHEDGSRGGCHQDDSATAAGPHGKHQDAQSKIVSDSLLAAAIAYCAVFFRGEVRIVRTSDSVTLEQTVPPDNSDNFLEFDATSLISTMFSNITSKEHKTDIELRRCQTITRMLAEHEMMEQKAGSDRILAGAKTIFFKYAACEDVWVEASLKVVAVALVTTVSVKSVLLTLFITVGMAILLGAQKPYQQRQ